MAINGKALTPSEQRAIEQIRLIWPHINFFVRYEYVKKMEHLFDYNFADTVLALSPITE